MSQDLAVEKRSGPRYVAYFPVRAEWDDDEGRHVVAEGETENVGPSGALVHLERLPLVGSRVQLAVLEEEGSTPRIQAVAEVLRVERNPVQPLAALQLVNSADEWRGLVWEPASTWERDHAQIEYEDD
jgi:PilZ domain